MRRTTVSVIILVLLAFTAACTIQYTQPVPARPSARAPRVTIVRPVNMYYMDSYGVYYIPDISYEVFFTNGLWYFRYQNNWHWGRDHNGPWTLIAVNKVPPGLRKLPRDYRNRWKKHKRVPYGYWNRKPSRARKPAQPSKALPALKIREPGTLFLLTGFNIYYAPDSNFEIFFHLGSWYRLYDGYWYSSGAYNGIWQYQPEPNLPPGLRELPRDYRDRRHKADRVPYGHWKKRKHDDSKKYRAEKPKSTVVAKVKPPVKRERQEKGQQIEVTDRDWVEERRPKVKAEVKPEVKKGDDRRDKKVRKPAAKPPVSIQPVSRPAQLYFIKSSGVYFIPDIKQEVFYHKGSWFNRQKGKWYSGDSFNGPWIVLDPRGVPDDLKKLPKNYRSKKFKKEMVPYDHWDKQTPVKQKGKGKGKKLVM